MKFLSKQFISVLTVFAVLAASTPLQAASLTSVSDTMSSHSAGKVSVTHVIKFLPASNIPGPGNLKITFASGYDLTNVIASSSSYVTVAGGNVTWNAVLNADLVGNVLTLGWTSGTLSSGNQVQVTINSVKNPASAGNYSLTLEAGENISLNPTDTRVITTVITNGDVAVTAVVAAAPASPTITSILPEETIIISSGGTQVINFTLTDANNDNIAYTITPSTGAISVAPSPASPVSGTAGGKVITFTYFANGAVDAQTIDVTADDGNGPIVYHIQIFII